MKKSDLVELLGGIPDPSIDEDIVISKCFIIDEDEKITGVLDVPIFGIAIDEKKNELRFILKSEDVKSCFCPEDVTSLEYE